MTRTNGHARRRKYRENQFMFRSTPDERRMLEKLADQLGGVSLNDALCHGIVALDGKLNPGDGRA